MCVEYVETCPRQHLAFQNYGHPAFERRRHRGCTRYTRASIVWDETQANGRSKARDRMGGPAVSLLPPMATRPSGVLVLPAPAAAPVKLASPPAPAVLPRPGTQHEEVTVVSLGVLELAPPEGAAPASPAAAPVPTRLPVHLLAPPALRVLMVLVPPAIAMDVLAPPPRFGVLVLPAPPRATPSVVSALLVPSRLPVHLPSPPALGMPVLLDEGAVAKEKLGPPISEPPKNSSHDHLLIFLTQHGIRALFESCRWLEEEERQRGGGKDGQKAKWEIGNEWGRYPLV
jgi:hypothetical protein